MDNFFTDRKLLKIFLSWLKKCFLFRNMSATKNPFPKFIMLQPSKKYLSELPILIEIKSALRDKIVSNLRLY